MSVNIFLTDSTFCGACTRLSVKSQHSERESAEQKVESVRNWSGRCCWTCAAAEAAMMMSSMSSPILFLLTFSSISNSAEFVHKVAASHPMRSLYELRKILRSRACTAAYAMLLIRTSQNVDLRIRTNRSMSSQMSSPECRVTTDIPESKCELRIPSSTDARFFEVGTLSSRLCHRSSRI